jgi:hypothetical protein
MATELVRAGVPFVVAMQAGFTDLASKWTLFLTVVHTSTTSQLRSACRLGRSDRDETAAPVASGDF